MGLGDQASDWQVCGVGQVGVGLAIAAGDYVFDFYSSSLAMTARMRFYGVGVGLGGNASGTALPKVIGPFGPWSAIGVDQPFSINDLNNCWGRLTTVDVGAGVSFGAVYITAAPRFWSSNTYFNAQNVGGFALGLGAGAIVLIGGWKFWYVTNSGSNSDTTYGGQIVADDDSSSDDSDDDDSDA